MMLNGQNSISPMRMLSVIVPVALLIVVMSLRVDMQWLALALFVLNVMTWFFIWNLDPFRQSLWLERPVRQRVPATPPDRAISSPTPATPCQIVSRMSHEMRTSLNAILGFSETLQSPQLKDEMRMECAKTIHRSGQQLLSLVNDLLDLCAIESGHLEPANEATDLRALCADVCEEFEQRAGEEHLQFSCKIAGDVPQIVHTDGRRLRQVLNYLLNYAISCTEQGTVRVDVESTEKRHELEFVIMDTSDGIAPEGLSAIFNPFSRTGPDPARQLDQSGLALAITRSLARLLGGDLAVQNEPGIGSTYRLTIVAPAIESSTSVGDPPTPEEISELRRSDASQSLRILFVDDSLVNRRLTQVQLRGTGWDLDLAENGLQGLELALDALQRGASYDVIVMDMQMPVMDGTEAVRRLRQEGFTGPILALTANALAGDANVCLQAGCNAYRSKPIKQQDLIAEIKRLRDQPRSADAAVG